MFARTYTQMHSNTLSQVFFRIKIYFVPYNTHEHNEHLLLFVQMCGVISFF